MKITKIKSLFILSMALVFTVLITVYFMIRMSIKSDIDRICENAVQTFNGDKITALICLISSKDATIQEKDNAIWALGKLRSKKALPVLKSMYSGKECNHSHFVCQREVEKAIENIEGNKIDIMTFR